MQMSLVKSMRFIFGEDQKDVSCKFTFSIPGHDVIALELRLLTYRVFIHTYSLLPERYFYLSTKRVTGVTRGKRGNKGNKGNKR